MEKIIIDADTGVDDMFAILLAAMSNKFELKAVTTVAGNCSLENSTRNSLKILDLCNSRKIPVYKGESKSLIIEDIDATNVHGKNGLGDVQYIDVERKPENMHAVDYMIKTVNENPGEITIVAIGPLTNVAKAIQKNGQFEKNIKKLIIMGGSQTEGNITPYAEFNFYKDPHAAKIVFESKINEIVMVGLDVTTKIPLTDKLEKMLQEINNEISDFVYKATRLGAMHDRNVGLQGLILNDPLTIAYLIDENVLKLEKSNVEIVIEGEKIGKSSIKKCETSNCKIACDIDVKKFYQILFTNIFSEYTDILKKYI